MRLMLIPLAYQKMSADDRLVEILYILRKNQNTKNLSTQFFFVVENSEL